MTSTKEIKKDQTAYLDDGRVCRFVGIFEDRYVVKLGFCSEDEAAFEDDEHYTWFGERDHIVDRIHTEPPVALIDDQIQSRLKTVNALDEAMQAKRAERHEIERDVNDTAKALAKYEPLKHIRDILDGKVTHVIVQDHPGYKIKTWAEADLWRRGERDRERFRLISLHALDEPGEVKRVHPRLQWFINGYSDGSGHDAKIWLCISEEEAKSKAGQMFREDIGVKWSCLSKMSGNSSWVSNLFSLMNAADEHGVEISKEQRDWFDVEKIKKENKKNEARERKLAELQEQSEKIKAEMANTTA